jgi:hypothetical protein
MRTCASWSTNGMCTSLHVSAYEAARVASASTAEAYAVKKLLPMLEIRDEEASSFGSGRGGNCQFLPSQYLYFCTSKARQLSTCHELIGLRDSEKPACIFVAECSAAE